MKILIAEDEPVLARFLVHVLSEYGPCTHVETGLAAVEAFESALGDNEPYQLVVLDIMMPEASGQDALREIRLIESEQAIRVSEHVAVMICSALEDAENIYKAHSHGCLEYLVKPVGKKEITKALGRLGFARPEKYITPDA
jgi:two-component system chemotaxis response regulator CheY